MKRLSKEELSREIGKIISTSTHDIAIDEYDVEILSNNKNFILMSLSEDAGVNASSNVMQFILNDLKSEEVQINEAKSFLLSFEIHPDYEMKNISDSMDILYEAAEEEADIIFGTSTNPERKLDYVKITCFAGF